MIFDPDVVIKSLSALASTLSIASSVQKIMKNDNVNGSEAIDKFKKTAKQQEILILSDPSVVESIVEITIISPKLLGQLAREARKCEQTHIASRGRAVTQTEKDQADIDAAQCMCSVLRSIKRYNKGILPDGGNFKNWWDSYNCRD